MPLTPGRLRRIRLRCPARSPAIRCPTLRRRPLPSGVSRKSSSDCSWRSAHAEAALGAAVSWRPERLRLVDRAAVRRRPVRAIRPPSRPTPAEPTSSDRPLSAGSNSEMPLSPARDKSPCELPPSTRSSSIVAGQVDGRTAGLGIREFRRARGFVTQRQFVFAAKARPKPEPSSCSASDPS